MSQQQSKTDRVEFFPAQEQFLRADKRYLGYISGVGAGKTFAGNWRTWLNMEKWNPGEMGAIVAPTRQMIVNVIIPEMRELGFLDRWEHKSSHSDQPGLHSPNGSRALLLSADNKKTIQRLRGLNLAWWHVDEKTAVPRRAQEILEQRLRAGNYRNGYVTTTPNGKDDTYDFFVGDVDADKRAFGESTIYESDDRLAIAGVPTDANPHTPEDYKEAMQKDMPDEIRQQEVQGEFVEIGSGLFKREMLQFVQPKDLPNRDLKYAAAVDVGVESDSMKARDNDTDYWSITLGGVDPLKPKLYVVDTHRKRGMSLKQGIAWIKSCLSGFNSSIEVWVESNQSQRWLQQELSDQGINAIPVNHTEKKENRLIQMSIPLERGTVQFVNQPPESGQERAEWMDYFESRGYGPRWENLVQELLSFPEGSHDDQIDSLETLIDSVNLGAETNFMGGDMYER